MNNRPAHTACGSLVDVPGIEVGQHTLATRLSGCSVALARAGAVAAVDVRGAAPGTRETDLLDAANLVQQVQASGVMRWLDERGLGFVTPHGVVPIVPAAVLFDLPLVRPGDDSPARPDAEAGFAACEAASRNPPASGNVGAGAGATVGKLFGALLDTQAALLAGQRMQPPVPGTHTTIGVIATNARLDKAQAKRLAMSGHDGLAHSIRPAHTPFDGDTLFAMATGTETAAPDLLLLSAMSAEAVALATVDAACSAVSVQTLWGQLPGAGG